MVDIIDLHTHTIASGHAYNTIYEMARSASERGLSLLGITDHGPAMQIAVPRNYFNNFKMLPRSIYGIHVLFGCELNILNPTGEVDLPEFMLQKLDYGVASIHRSIFQNGTPGTLIENTDAYLGAMEQTSVRIIGHPDDRNVPVDFAVLVKAARDHHILLEVNSESLNPRCAREGTYENNLKMLDLCQRYGVSIVLDSDAHCEVEVGNHRKSIEMLEKIHFPEELVVNRSLEAAADFLPKLRSLLDEA